MDDADPSWGQLGFNTLQILLIAGITLRKWIEDEALRGDCRQAQEQRCVPAAHCEDPSSVRQSNLGILHGQKLRQDVSGVPKLRKWEAKATISVPPGSAIFASAPSTLRHCDSNLRTDR